MGQFGAALPMGSLNAWPRRPGERMTLEYFQEAWKPVFRPGMLQTCRSGFYFRPM
jgi:hypothetical protein